MKKHLIVLLCILFLICLYGCGGNVDHAQTHTVDSELYTQQEISSAIAVIKQEFKLKWDGCTLTEISYAGDETTQSYQEWSECNDADEVIVLTSSFDVDSSGGDGSLNPNSTYDNWQWILVRTKGGTWTHVDHGY